MNITLAIIFCLLTLQPGIDNQIADQTSFYLENITAGKEVSESFWALNEIYSSTCADNNSIIRFIINSDFKESKKYFSQGNCGATKVDQQNNKLDRIKLISLDKGLFDLSIHYLLNESDKDLKKLFSEDFLKKWGTELSILQKELINSIIQETKLEMDVIESIESNLIFNSFLYTSNFSTFFNIDDYGLVAKKLLDNYDYKNEEKNLVSSLKLVAIIGFLLEIDSYGELRNYSEYLVEDDLYPISKDLTRAFNFVNYSLFVIGRYDESLILLRNHIIPLSKYLNLSDLKDASQSMLGVDLYSLGKFEEAKNTFEELYFDSTNTLDKSELFNNLSICYFKLGEKNKYLNLQLSALEEVKKPSDYKKKLVILRNLFIYYTSIKDSQTALSYLKTAEEIAVENNDNYELAAIHAFSGTFYWDFYKNSDMALSELEIALSEFDPTTDFVDYVNVLKEESEILISIGSYSSAIEKLTILKNLSTQTSNTLNYLEALIGLAEIELINNNFEDAQKLIDEIQVYSLDNLDFELSVKYNTVLSTFTYKKGEKRKAYNLLLPVVDQIVQRSKTSIDSQTGFWTIQPEYINAFNSLIGMLIEAGNYTRALQLLDQLKTINDVALYNSPILRAKKLSEEDLTQDQFLNDQIISLRTKYLNSTSSEKFRIKADIDRLSAQREQILNKIRTYDNDQPVTIWSIQNRLESGELIIHFTEIGDKLYASYVTRENIEIDVIEFDPTKKRLFEETANNLASSNTNLNQLYSIYKILNLEYRIPSEVNSLTVIPDNYLYRLPLDILPTKKPETDYSYGSAQYLIEDYHLKYFSSLTDYLGNTRTRETKFTTDFSAFALSDFSEFDNQNLPSLPFATVEVQKVTAQLTNFDSKNVFLEGQADKTSFLKSTASSRIIHVATHSEVSEQDPLFSTIYLNNNSSENLTSLYAYELFDSKIENDLIMLNSCSSGSGNYLQGSGIMGISRALRYAGAKSLALNLWSVNDKTASEFATSFYSNINNGISKSEALREAKLTLLMNSNANPYYWGAYMLIGNPSQLTEKPAKAGFLYSFLILMILGIGYQIRGKTY